MAEHLHGYPSCTAQSGQPCSESDLNYEECKGLGGLRSCEPSVVDGIPTGQYRCTHSGADAGRGPKPAKKKKKPASKTPKKAAKAPARKASKPAKKKTAKKAAKPAKRKKAGRAAAKPKKAARKAKPARKAPAKKSG